MFPDDLILGSFVPLINEILNVFIVSYLYLVTFSKLRNIQLHHGTLLLSGRLSRLRAIIFARRVFVCVRPISSSKSTVVDAITPTHTRVELQARLAWKGYDEERPDRRSTPSSDPNIINTTWVAANVYDINMTTAHCRYKSGYVLKRCKYMPSRASLRVYTQRLRCSYAESVPSSHGVNRLPIDSKTVRRTRKLLKQEMQLTEDNFRRVRRVIFNNLVYYKNPFHACEIWFVASICVEYAKRIEFRRDTIPLAVESRFLI